MQDPIETYRNAAGIGKIHQLLKQFHKPLPTTFRSSLSVSVPIELKELATMLGQHGVNVSRELEGPIKSRLVKLAMQINSEAKEKQKAG